MKVMIRMQHVVIAVGLGLVAAACAAGRAAAPNDTAAGDANRPATPEKVVRLLDELETRGRRLASYQAKVVYTREQKLLADKQTRVGRVVYQAADANAGRPPRFAIRFDTLVVDGALRERPRAYIFDGHWLAEVHGDTKQFIRREITAPNESYDPLQIGEGPFPLPLGQQRREVLELYEVSLIEPNAGDPNAARHLRLTPRPAAKQRHDFARVDLWYDRQTLLPVKIVTMDESNNITTVLLKDAKVNKLDAADMAGRFDTTPPKAGGWQVEVIPRSEAAGGGAQRGMRRR